MHYPKLFSQKSRMVWLAAALLAVVFGAALGLMPAQQQSFAGEMNSANSTVSEIKKDPIMDDITVIVTTIGSNSATPWDAPKLALNKAQQAGSYDGHEPIYVYVEDYVRITEGGFSPYWRVKCRISDTPPSF